MNGNFKSLAKKIIRKYRKELSLTDWDIDVEFNNQVKTGLYTNLKKREAFIAINKRECKTQRKLSRIIQYQLILLKERIHNAKKK